MKRRCYSCRERKPKKEVVVITVAIRVEIFLVIPKQKWACQPCLKKHDKNRVNSPGELQAECLMQSHPGLRIMSDDVVKVGKELFDEKNQE